MMRSKHQMRANRSTGPRTDSGKSRSRANAARHGLASKLVRDAGLLADVVELAKLLAREYGQSVNSPHVRAVAEAQISILRARQARVRLVEQMNPEHATNRADAAITIDNSPPRDSGSLDRKFLGTLATIDRCEGHALYRRQHGLRRLILEMSCV
jgi:hypothetical protein